MRKFWLVLLIVVTLYFVSEALTVRDYWLTLLIFLIGMEVYLAWIYGNINSAEISVKQLSELGYLGMDKASGEDWQMQTVFNKDGKLLYTTLVPTDKLLNDSTIIRKDAFQSK